MLVIEKMSLYSHCKPSTLFSISLWFNFFIPCLQPLCKYVHVCFWTLLLSSFQNFQLQPQPCGRHSRLPGWSADCWLKHPPPGLTHLGALFSLKGFSELLILSHSLYWVKILLRICWVLWIPWLTNAYVQMHTDCSACTDVTAPGSPETQGQWVSTCGRSPTATVFLTFPFSLKIRDFYYFFRLSYGLFVIHSFLWKKRKAEGQCTFLVLSHLSLHQHRP